MTFKKHVHGKEGQREKMIKVMAVGAGGTVVLLRGEGEAVGVDGYGIVTPASPRAAAGSWQPLGVVAGVLGSVALGTLHHLVCVREVTQVASLQGGRLRLFRLLGLTLFPLAPPHSISPQQTAAAADFQKFLASFEFHFSPDFDFTHTLQRLGQGPLLPCDRRFWWNAHLARHFTEAGFSQWITVVTDAFVGQISDGPLTYTLISRRSRRRQGTRFLVRGIDLLGNAANFVEHEQLVELAGVGGGLSSFVQVRGSIPLTWQQKGDGELMPKPVLVSAPLGPLAHREHWRQLKELYGQRGLLAISLVDSHGAEGVVGAAYERAVRQLNAEDATSGGAGDCSVGFVWFDFHAETKGPRKYDILPDVFASIISQLSFCHPARGRVQEGVVRTNCIDCLDRTNVVQSVIARGVLVRQLEAMGVYPDAAMTEAFEVQLKALWSDNANAMSLRYTGVGALKTDYTRTGKRSGKGLLSDGLKSVQRLAQSVFRDSDKQLYTELLLGVRSSVQRRAPSNQSPLSWYASCRDEALGGGRGRDVSAWVQSAGHNLCVVEIHGSLLVRYEVSSQLETVWPLKMILSVLPLPGKPRGCRILLRDNPEPVKLFFFSVTVRDRFVSTLGLNVMANPILSPRFPKPEGEGLSVLILSWRDCTVPTAPPQCTPQTAATLAASIFGSVPRDHAVVAFALQNPTGSVPQDDPFVRASLLSTPEYLVHLLSVHLGPLFQLVQLADASPTVVLGVWISVALAPRLLGSWSCGLDGGGSGFDASLSSGTSSPAPSRLASRVRQQLSGPSLHASSDIGCGVGLSFDHVKPIHFLATGLRPLPRAFWLSGKHATHLRPFNITPPTRHVFWMAGMLPATMPLCSWSALAARPTLGHILASAAGVSNLLSSHPAPAPPLDSPQPLAGPVVCSFRLPVAELSPHSLQVSIWAVALRPVGGAGIGNNDDALHLRFWTERTGEDDCPRSAVSRDFHWRSTILLTLPQEPMPLDVEISLWHDKIQIGRGSFVLEGNALGLKTSHSVTLLDSAGAAVVSGNLMAQWDPRVLSEGNIDPVLALLGRNVAAPPPIPSRSGR